MLPRPLDWSLMVPARPPTPCKSTKSRLPDAEITKGPSPQLLLFSKHASMNGALISCPSKYRRSYFLSKSERAIKSFTKIYSKHSFFY